MQYGRLTNLVSRTNFLHQRYTYGNQSCMCRLRTVSNISLSAMYKQFKLNLQQVQFYGVIGLVINTYGLESCCCIIISLLRLILDLNVEYFSSVTFPFQRPNRFEIWLWTRYVSGLYYLEICTTIG